MIIGKSGCAKTTLLRPGWLDYTKINIFGKILFQPEYHIFKKAFEETIPYEVIIRLFENQNDITDLGISPISIVEEMVADHVGSDMTKEEFRQLCKTGWEKQHGFVIIDLSSRKHNGKYRSGLNEFYIPNYFLIKNGESS